MSYGPDVPGFFSLAARYVDRILKGGKPAEIPVEQPTKFLFAGEPPHSQGAWIDHSGVGAADRRRRPSSGTINMRPPRVKGRRRHSSLNASSGTSTSNSNSSTNPTAQTTTASSTITKVKTVVSPTTAFLRPLIMIPSLRGSRLAAGPCRRGRGCDFNVNGEPGCARPRTRGAYPAPRFWKAVRRCPRRPSLSPDLFIFFTFASVASIDAANSRIAFARRSAASLASGNVRRAAHNSWLMIMTLATPFRRKNPPG